MKKILLIAVVAVIAFSLVCCTSSEPTAEAPVGNSEASAQVDLSNIGEEEVVVENEVVGPVSPTTGLPTDTPVYRPVIVQLDNEKTGRPQYGIQDADIVYESMIEGADTRLTALFNDILPEKAGPVRSARVYHQQLAAEWDPIFIHEGGPFSKTYPRSYIYSEENGGVFDVRIDGSKLGDSDVIWDQSYGFTYCSPLAAVAENDFVREQRDPLFNFDADVDYATAPAVAEIMIPFLSTNHEHVTYTYDATDDKFVRYRYGEEFKDAETDEAVRVQNVIVEYCDLESLGSEEDGRILMHVIDSGKAEFYVGGKHMTGTWEKESVTGATIYKLSDGSELVLKPGNTWIEIQPSKNYVITKYANGTQYPAEN